MEESDSFHKEENHDDFDEAPHEYEDDPVVEEKKEFTVLDEQALRERMHVMVADVSETLSVSEPLAIMLLRAFGWNQEKFVSKFLENKNHLLRESGLQFVGLEEDTSEDKTKHGKTKIPCTICTDQVPWLGTRGVGCGHRFCVDCWVPYLEDRVSMGKHSTRTPCPQHKCTAIVPDSFFKHYLKAELYQKYEQNVVRAFVEDSRAIKWCPAPRCDRAIQASGAVYTVACACGYKFCFKCSEEDHQPASCADLARWLDKCRNESETVNWIIANTKKCPKCMVRIEKNQGCNHMTCRGCKFEFCWVCMGNWAEHGNHTGGFYKCNKYDPKKNKRKEGDDESQAKAELDRYLHYYQRFHIHDDSRKFAAKQIEKVHAKMNEIQKESRGSKSWMDVQFLKEAVEQVFECRRVLKYTYVFAYYLPDGKEKTLFEFLQQQLETSTEHLAELSERPHQKLDPSELENFRRITANFMANLLDGVANGLTK